MEIKERIVTNPNRRRIVKTNDPNNTSDNFAADVTVTDEGTVTQVGTPITAAVLNSMVDTSNDQTIGGAKTFSSAVKLSTSGSIVSGNTSAVTGGAVYTAVNTRIQGTSVQLGSTLASQGNGNAQSLGVTLAQVKAYPMITIAYTDTVSFRHVNTVFTATLDENTTYCFFTDDGTGNSYGLKILTGLSAANITCQTRYGTMKDIKIFGHK